jgi:hypothetical protein
LLAAYLHKTTFCSLKRKQLFNVLYDTHLQTSAKRTLATQLPEKHADIQLRKGQDNKCFQEQKRCEWCNSSEDDMQTKTAAKMVADCPVVSPHQTAVQVPMQNFFPLLCADNIETKNGQSTPKLGYQFGWQVQEAPATKTGTPMSIF